VGFEDVMRFIRMVIFEAFKSLAVFFPLSVAPDEIIPYQLLNGSTAAPLARFRECEVCPEMIVIPLGSFMMGATAEESA
jgi:hypothetical protein